MSDIDLMTEIERYLNGEMTEDERIHFELLRRKKEGVDSAITEHQEFTERLKEYGERVEFESLLNAIHSEIDVQALKDEFVHHPSTIVRLWRNHHSKISVAASIAIFAVLATLFFTGYLKTQNQEANVIKLRLEVDKVKHSTQQIQSTVNHMSGGAHATDYKGIGTGFAISSNYIVTNFHVVNNADSVFVQNADGDTYHAKIISSDPTHDLAILKISDPDFKGLGALPYGFKKAKADLGEDVFTYGYSKDDAVYNKGYLSSDNGAKGDSTTYQISSMDVNYGNSGSPLLDAKGNIIAIVSGKQAHAEGEAFAIKSKYLFKAMKADSLLNNITLNGKSSMANLSRTQQIKKLSNYVFMVKVYNN